MSLKEEVQYASAVMERTESVIAEGKVPIVVLDLDLTLLDNRERTRSILRDYVLSRETSPRNRSAALELLSTREISYSIQENMEALGIEGDEFRNVGLPFWLERFFSDRYCVFDIPYGGAAEACRRLAGTGALLVYLTGRYADTQAVGTLQSLRHFGFPVAEIGTQLVMKTSRQESDRGYKRRVSEEILRMGVPVAAVDNEPGHCNTMSELFSGAHVAQFGSMHSPQAPNLNEGIHRIFSWMSFAL
jgi:hypothetical protein